MAGVHHTRTIVLTLLVIAATGPWACCGGDDPVEVADPMLDLQRRQQFNQRAQEVRDAFAGGRLDAVDLCAALGDEALTMGIAEAAAEVAWIDIEQRRYGDALAYLDRADELYPSSDGIKDLLYPRAAALDELGRPAEAAAVFASALAIEPTNPFEYSGSAELWVAAGDHGRAARTVDSGLQRFPGDVVLLQARAEVTLRRGDAAEALRQLDQLAADNPFEVGVLVLQLEALAVLDDRDALRAAASNFDDNYPALGFGPVFLGLAEARDGRDEAAAAAWRRAEEVIAACEICAGDEADVLVWARAQAGAETVEPLPR